MIRREMQSNDSRWVLVEDYVFDWPCLRCQGSRATPANETSVMQETAIRRMEDG